MTEVEFTDADRFPWRIGPDHELEQLTERSAKPRSWWRRWLGRIAGYEQA